MNGSFFSKSLGGPADLPAHPTHAVVLLHGFGASGDDLIGLSTPLKAALGQFTASFTKNLAVFAPHAPQPSPFAGGYQWFADMGWTFNDPAGQQAAHEKLDEYLTSITEKHGLARENIAVIGFSQGGMQALYSVPRLAEPVAGFITIASKLNNPERPEPAAIVPLLMLHGTADDVVPADETLKAAATLETWGYSPTTHLLEGLPHGIDARCLVYTAEFLHNLWG